MYNELVKNKKVNKKLLSSDKKQIKYKIKTNSKNNILPPINKPNDIYSKIKKSSLSNSINILYKSLFPDEKNTLDNFLNKYPSKYYKKPKWKFTITKSRNDDKIRKELMKKNKTMRSYEYLRQPTILKKELIRKPKMVQIVEDNFSYKYRFFLNPWEEEYNLYKNNKNKSSLNNFEIFGI